MIYYARGGNFGVISGRRTPTSTKIGPMLIQFGPNCAKFGRSQPKLARCAPNLVNNGPMLVEFGVRRPEITPRMPPRARRTPNSTSNGPMLTTFDPNRANSGRLRPKLARFMPKLVNIGPPLVGFGVRRPRITPKSLRKQLSTIFRALLEHGPQAPFGGEEFGDGRVICSRRPPHNMAAFLQHVSTKSQKMGLMEIPATQVKASLCVLHHSRRSRPCDGKANTASLSLSETAPWIESRNARLASHVHRHPTKLCCKLRSSAARRPRTLA